MEGSNKEEEFSDDSLEVKETKKKKKKKTRRAANSNRRSHYRSYLQIYQRRLTNEILKSNSTVEEPLKKSPRSESSDLHLQGESPPLNESLEKSAVSISETIKKANESSKVRKPSENLWSEFLSRKYKLQHTKSEVNEKIELLRKRSRRLEYGKRMSSINKINQMCFKLKEKKVSKLASQKSSKETNEGDEKLEKTCGSVSILSAKQKKESESAESIKTIQKRLEQLQIRHQKDKKLAEKIQRSLKIVDDEVLNE
jgi:hypothetical protein